MIAIRLFGEITKIYPQRLVKGKPIEEYVLKTGAGDDNSDLIVEVVGNDIRKFNLRVGDKINVTADLYAREDSPKRRTRNVIRIWGCQRGDKPYGVTEKDWL